MIMKAILQVFQPTLIPIEAYWEYAKVKETYVLLILIPHSMPLLVLYMLRK